MRSRIDISEIEAETKIRAKYLRALENEEWDLLPGPDVRQELPAHVRRRAGPRRAAARRGVQAAPRAPVRRRAAADLAAAARASSGARALGAQPLPALRPGRARDRGSRRRALRARAWAPTTRRARPAAGPPRRRRGRRTAPTAARTTTQRSEPKPATLRITATGQVVVCVADRRRPQARERPDAAGRAATSTLRSGALPARPQQRPGAAAVNGRTRAIPPSDGRSATRSRRGGKITGLGPSGNDRSATRERHSTRGHRRHGHRGAHRSRARPQRAVAGRPADGARRRPRARP